MPLGNTGPAPLAFDDQIDTSGLACPMPLLKMKLKLKELQPEQVLYVISTDQGSWQDFHKFAEITAHSLLDAQQVDDSYHYWIKKGH